MSAGLLDIDAAANLLGVPPKDLQKLVRDGVIQRTDGRFHPVKLVRSYIEHVKAAGERAQYLTQNEAAQRLDMSERNFREVCQHMDIDHKKTRFDDVVIAYVRDLREKAAGRATAGVLDLAAERARLAAEQADKIAFQNRVTRREYAPVSVIEESLASVGRQIAGIMEAIPVKLKRSTNMTAEQLEQVERDLAEARNLAAVVKPDWSQIDVPSAD